MHSAPNERVDAFVGAGVGEEMQRGRQRERGHTHGSSFTYVDVFDAGEDYAQADEDGEKCVGSGLGIPVDGSATGHRRSAVGLAM